MVLKLAARRLGFSMRQYRRASRWLLTVGALSHLGPGLGLVGREMPQLVTAVLGSGTLATATFLFVGLVGVDRAADMLDIY